MLHHVQPIMLFVHTHFVLLLCVIYICFWQADAEEDLQHATAALIKEQESLAASANPPEMSPIAELSSGKPCTKAVIGSESETEVADNITGRNVTQGHIQPFSTRRMQTTGEWRAPNHQTQCNDERLLFSGSCLVAVTAAALIVLTCLISAQGPCLYKYSPES